MPCLRLGKESLLAVVLWLPTIEQQVVQMMLSWYLYVYGKDFDS
jgi:hypothetical protein